MLLDSRNGIVMPELSREAVLKRKIAYHLDMCSDCRKSLATRGNAPACQDGRDLSLEWLQLRAGKNDAYATQLLSEVKKNEQ
jgi:hypothetical protein